MPAWQSYPGEANLAILKYAVAIDRERKYVRTVGGFERSSHHTFRNPLFSQLGWLLNDFQFFYTKVLNCWCLTRAFTGSKLC